MNNSPPIIDRSGRPLNGTPDDDFDPIKGLLWPTYLNIVPAVISNPGVCGEEIGPQEAADTAMDYAIAALAKIGFNITQTQPKENL